MSGDQRTGPGPDPAEDDVVVRHPFGSDLEGRPTAGGTADVEASPESHGADVGEDVGEDVDTVPEQVGAVPEQREAGEPERELPEAQLPAAETAGAPDAGAPVAADPEPQPEPEEQPETPVPAKPSRRRTRDPLAAALIGVLTLLLGFAFAVQVRSVGDDQEYAGAREEDLVRILDELNAREERLREQISDQRIALQQLTSSDSQSATALEEARARAEAIGILNGTIAAEGPGLVMIIRDAGDDVRVSDILDAIQELRGAGAETMQIDGVRVGVSTAVTGTPGDLMVDGRPITSPYEFVVIGSPQNMETALNIPGGVVQDLTRHGASVTITQSEQVVVDALRPLDTPQYASPDTGG
jgi:uncharacterized protein YlxW (UPF0749 family)